jgi:hypothetical protein
VWRDGRRRKEEGRGENREGTLVRRERGEGIYVSSIKTPDNVSLLSES